MIVFICFAWLMVLLTGGSGKAAYLPSPRVMQKLSLPTAATFSSHGAKFLLAVPLSGVCSLLLTVSLIEQLPWTMLNKIAVSIFVFPVLWGAFSSWVCSQYSTVRPLALLGGLCLFSGLLIQI